MDEKPRRFRFGLPALFALVAAVGVLACFWNPFTKPSIANVGLIEIGMTLAEVERLVGDSDTRVIESDGQLRYGYNVNSGEGWIIVLDSGKVFRRPIPVVFN